MTGGQDSSKNEKTNLPGNLLLYRLRDEVDKNLQNEQFGVEELAELIGMSRSNLHRKLQESTWTTVQAVEVTKNERALTVSAD